MKTIFLPVGVSNICYVMCDLFTRVLVHVAVLFDASHSARSRAYKNKVETQINQASQFAIPTLKQFQVSVLVFSHRKQ